MTSAATAAKCPNCGAPLSLLPDGTCRWCHGVVKASSNENFALAALWDQLGDLWKNEWTLTAAPGTKRAVPWSFGTRLLSPAKEILAVLGDGVTQPGMQAIAKVHDLDFQFRLLMNSVMGAGIEVNDKEGPMGYLEVCDLLDAVAGFHDTDPQWAARAHECAAQARSNFGAEWQAAIAGNDPDVFQADLLAWIKHHLKSPGGHHFWQR